MDHAFAQGGLFVWLDPLYGSAFIIDAFSFLQERGAEKKSVAMLFR